MKLGGTPATACVYLRTRLPGDPLGEFGVLEILRVLARYDAQLVLDSRWLVQELEALDFGIAAPGQSGWLRTGDWREVRESGSGLAWGWELLVMFVISSQVENVLLARMADPLNAPVSPSRLRAYRAPESFQVSSTDLEIRVGEVGEVSVVTTIHEVIEVLTQQLPRGLLVNPPFESGASAAAGQ